MLICTFEHFVDVFFVGFAGGLIAFPIGIYIYLKIKGDK